MPVTGFKGLYIYKMGRVGGMIMMMTIISKSSSSRLVRRSKVPPVRRVGGGRRRSFPHFLPDTPRQMLEQGFRGSGNQNHSSVGNIWDSPNLRSSGQYVALIKKIKEHLLSHLINILI